MKGGARAVPAPFAREKIWTNAYARTELHDGLVEVARTLMTDQLFCFFQNCIFSFWGVDGFPDPEEAGKETKDIPIHNR